MIDLIAKMNFVSITGPRGDIDRIVDKYLTRYEIHLEYAPSELKTVATLRPYIEQNIYREQLTRMKELAEYMGKPEYENVDTDVKRAAEKIDYIYEELNKYKNAIEEIVNKKAIIDTKLEKVQNIPLAQLHPFKDHPFKILNNEETPMEIPLNFHRMHLEESA